MSTCDYPGCTITEAHGYAAHRVFQSAWEHCTSCGRKRQECNGTNICKGCRQVNDDLRSGTRHYNSNEDDV